MFIDKWVRSWNLPMAGAALALSLFFGVESHAQDGPQCDQTTYGQAGCFANVQCECIYDRGGIMTGVPEGYRWDCGISRPRCEDVPATIIEYRGTPPSYPLAVGMERTDSSINIGP